MRMFFIVLGSSQSQIRMYVVLEDTDSWSLVVHMSIKYCRRHLADEI